MTQREAILDELDFHSACSIGYLAIVLDAPKPSIRRVLRDLIAEGVAVRCKEDSGLVYFQRAR
jgi:predicted ArsR family transcriptional regulator